MGGSPVVLVGGFAISSLRAPVPRKETKVSKNIKAFMAMGFLAVISACGVRDPESVAEPEPIMAEPVMEKL